MSAPAPRAFSAPGRKRVLLVLAAAFDPPADGTPLSEAETPALDGMARRGRAGMVDIAADTSWDGFCELLGLGGGAPSLGAADAAGAGVAVGPGEVVWRADLVTLDGRSLKDARSGGIRDPEASALLDAARAALPGVRLSRLDGNRNLAVAAGPAEPSPPPWEMLARPVSAGLLPEGRLRGWFDAARAALAAHDVNQVRIDLGENPANALWFHGGGPAAPARLASPLGAKAVLVGRGPSTRGLAAMLGWTASVVDGDDDVLAAAALAAVNESDLVVVRTGSALAATATGGRAARRDALSALDARVVAPLLSVLEEMESFVLVAASDCAYDSRNLALVRGGVPCAVLASGDANGRENGGAPRFVETECVRSGFHVDPAGLAALLR